MKRAQAVDKAYYDRSAAKPTARVGSQVFVQIHIPEGPNYKVSPKFSGPFRINKILPCNKYEVLHETTLVKKVVHWNHLKLTTSTPWTKSEIELANKDIDTPVEEVRSQNDEVSTCRYPLRNRVRL